MFLPKNIEITAILQGPVVPKITLNAIRTIKHIFPNTPVFLSTWENEEISGILCDKTVTSTPPPSIIVHDNSEKISINNTNRLIFGVQQALKEVNTQYTLKLRTDIILQDFGFLKYWDLYAKRDSKYSLFTHRILNYYLFAPQFNYMQGKKIPTLFHPSDWMFFGLTEDLRKLFNIPLQPDPEYSLWWEHHTKPSRQIDCWPEAVFRYSPEQYLFYQAVKKKFPEIKFDNYLDITREKEELSRKIMVNNFTILDYRQWNIKMPKYQHVIGSIPYGQTSHTHWKQEYQKYCDSSCKISWREKLFIYMNLNLGEILKTKKIEWEKKFIITFFPSLYRKHLYKKYFKSHAKLKQKLEALSPTKRDYIYVEDAGK